MKFRLYLFSIFLICCKTSKSTLDDPIKSNLEKNCALKSLTKTIDYKNEIKKYTSIYNDTIIQIESFETNTTEYRTVLNLQQSSKFLWLLAIQENQTDSLLIDCVSTTKWVESKFFLDNCEIELTTENFDTNGIAILGTTNRIKYKN